MKTIIKVLTLASLLLIPLKGWGSVPADDETEYIQVDWYPLLTDSVGWNITSGGLAIGFVDALGSQAPQVAMGRSIELSWINVIGAKYNNGKGQRFTIGLGIDWKNYKLSSGHAFLRDEAGVISVGGFPAGADKCASRIKVFSLGVPIIFRQRIARKTDLFLGEVTNFNLHASLHTTYRVGDEKVDLKSNNIHQSPVTVDLITGVQYKKVGAYLRYCPFRVIKDGYGPDFSTLAVGLVFGL
ncbi:MAG: hypothetical protein J5523_00995 [Muribaculaceae bacterium]|nr:hypothetical protein [Muribaculaceae bacterium]